VNTTLCLDPVGLIIEKDDQLIHLTEEEAKRLYRDLHDLFHVNNKEKAEKPVRVHICTGERP
jgi:hypothetical protein